jgi:predicted aspartyl protease
MTNSIMEKDNMERVVAEITVENLEDVWRARKGEIADADVRKVTIANALVDTGATFLSLPTRVIRQLGLEKAFTKHVMTSKGLAESDVYDAVRLTIQDRTCSQDVMEVPDAVSALIGQLPLEALDFVVDQVGQKIIGNPAHGGEQMYDLL